MQKIINGLQLGVDQEEDEDNGPLVRRKEDEIERPGSSKISDESPSFKALWAQRDSLHVENGLLNRAWESPDGRHVTMQLVVPVTRIKEVLREMHSGSSGAHFGINKTLSKIRERFYWVCCRQDVESWCKKCTTCAAVKRPKIKARGQWLPQNVGSPIGILEEL